MKRMLDNYNRNSTPFQDQELVEPQARGLRDLKLRKWSRRRKEVRRLLIVGMKRDLKRNEQRQILHSIRILSSGMPPLIVQTQTQDPGCSALGN